MRSAVVYYSLTGNTKYIAQAISEAVEADLLQLHPKTDINPRGFMKYLVGGRQALFKHKQELKPLPKAPEEYDLLFIGTPVWAGTIVPALRSFFTDHPLEGKKVALFCCYRGGLGKVFSEMQQELDGSVIIDMRGFREPRRRQPQESRAQAMKWAKEVLHGASNEG